VHSLYFWWREYGRAERGSVEAAASPCYLNHQYPIDVALGVRRDTAEIYHRREIAAHVAAEFSPPPAVGGPTERVVRTTRGAAPRAAARHRGALISHIASRPYLAHVSLTSHHTSRSQLADCLAPPLREYEFPRDLYAYGEKRVTVVK